MATEFEITARWKKALKFAAYLYSWGILSGEIHKISDNQWAELALAIGQNIPSAATREITKTAMLMFEQAVAKRIRHRIREDIQNMNTVETKPILIKLRVSTTVETTMKYMDLAENRRQFSRMSSRVSKAETMLFAAVREWQEAMEQLLPDTGDTRVEVEINL